MQSATWANQSVILVKCRRFFTRDTMKFCYFISRLVTWTCCHSFSHLNTSCNSVFWYLDGTTTTSTHAPHTTTINDSADTTIHHIKPFVVSTSIKSSIATTSTTTTTTRASPTNDSTTKPVSTTTASVSQSSTGNFFSEPYFIFCYILHTVRLWFALNVFETNHRFTLWTKRTAF